MKQRNKEHNVYGAEAIIEAITEMLDSGERYVKGSARLSGSSFTFQTEVKHREIDNLQKNVSELPVEEDINVEDTLVVEEDPESKEEDVKSKAKKKQTSKMKKKGDKK